MKPLLSLQELTDLITNQKNGIANTTRCLGKYSPAYKELWRIVAKARSRDKNIVDTDFKQSAFHRLHGEGSTYDEKIIDQLLENLREFLEMYYNSCLINTAIGQLILASTLREQGYNKAADKAIENALVLVLKERESTQHYVESEVEKDKYYSNEDENAESLKRSKAAGINKFLVDHLSWIIEELTKHRRDGTKIKAALRKEIETTLLLVPEKTTPLLKVQLQGVAYYLNPNVAGYWAFRKAFFDHKSALNSDMGALLLSVINAIAIYPNITDEMRQDYLVLYRFGIENSLFIRNGKIPAMMFDNIVNTAQSRGDYTLLELAIEKFGNIISGEKSKERSLALAQAYLHYSRHEHDAVSEILTFLDNDNYLPPLLVGRKYILGFKSAFEKSPDKQAALVYMDAKQGSFRSILGKYVGKNISKADKRNYLHFFNILYRIADRNNKENTKQFLELELEECEGAILEAKWLRKKIAALPLWGYLNSFKEDYDETRSKYDALAIIKKKDAGFRKMLSRYMAKGFIHEGINKSFLNFYNLLVRICDTRNPRNAKRHLLKKLESYGNLIAEREWIEEKIHNLRP